MKELHQSRTDSVFLGVIGGVAEYFSLDATLLRIIFIVFLIATGLFPGVLIYFLAALFMTKAPARGTDTHGTAHDSAV